MKSVIWLLLIAIASLFYGCTRPLYTPAVFPSPQDSPKTEIRGPATTSLEEAQNWAIGEARRIGNKADYIIYRDLYWNKQRGMEMAKEKLR
jgi:hypothetical protein